MPPAVVSDILSTRIVTNIASKVNEVIHGSVDGHVKKIVFYMHEYSTDTFNPQMPSSITPPDAPSATKAYK